MQAFLASIFAKVVDKLLVRFVNFLVKLARKGYNAVARKIKKKKVKSELNKAIKEGEPLENVAEKGKDFLNSL